jgi:hypothetical protein
MKKIISVTIITAMLAYTSFSYSETKKSVNVLTWWGYLNDAKTSKLIEDKCGATLSYDNYTSNNDMLRRYSTSGSKYDLLIFSQTTYNAIKDQIILKNSELSKKSANYNPIIRKKYENSHFPNNIAFFMHSLTGFIWNPNIIDIDKNDSISSIFGKAKENKVILLDDPKEINMMLLAANKLNSENPQTEISLKQFKQLSQNTRVYISNEINNIYSQKDFAFSYQWSGDAFNVRIQKKNFKFLINDNLSYVATDLIAQLKDNQVAACTANVLASKEFLKTIQNKTHYFSPYGDIEDANDENFKELYKRFLLQLSKLQWLEPPTSLELKRLNKQWDKVKFELAEQRK